MPWDDAVTLALTYAEIPYDVVYDDELMNDELSTYDYIFTMKISLASTVSSIKALETIVGIFSSKTMRPAPKSMALPKCLNLNWP